MLDPTGPFLHVPQVGEQAPQHRGGVTEAQPAIERCRCDSEVEVDGGIIRCGVQFSQSLRVGELVEVRASQEADHVALVTIRFSFACTNSLDQRGQIFHIVSP
ncbi:MAG TPA: hypothetical protein DIC52_19290 [Candidatus Latescibacteria bacterium]|nr:hypothetical protein [Candidatus Latescibacterota bacterium]